MRNGVALEGSGEGVTVGEGVAVGSRGVVLGVGLASSSIVVAVNGTVAMRWLSPLLGESPQRMKPKQ